MRRLGLLATVLSGCIPSFESVDSGDPDAVWAKPENEWRTCSEGPPEGLQGEGYEAGLVIPDIRLGDQKGTTLSLWQYAGCTTVVDLSTIWCAPCQALAPELEKLHHEYEDQGVEAVTMLAEDKDGNPPDVDDLNVWVDLFEIEGAVIGDPDKTFSNDMVQNDAFPVVVVVGPDLVVRKRIVPGNDPAAIEDAILETLSE